MSSILRKGAVVRPGLKFCDVEQNAVDSVDSNEVTENARGRKIVVLTRKNMGRNILYIFKNS